MALSGDAATLVVGAIAEAGNGVGVGADGSDNSTVESGAVYVYTNSAGTWAEDSYIKASNTGGVDSFGFSAAVNSDGTAVAVGAYLEDSAATGIGGNQADNSAAQSGALYLY